MSSVGVEIRGTSFCFCKAYGRFFIASTESHVLEMVERFEAEEWKDNRLQSWHIYEVEE